MSVSQKTDINAEVGIKEWDRRGKGRQKLVHTSKF